MLIAFRAEKRAALFPLPSGITKKVRQMEQEAAEATEERQVPETSAESAAPARRRPISTKVVQSFPRLTPPKDKIAVGNVRAAVESWE